MNEAGLRGQRIIITRPREQAAELASMLEAVGAEVIEFPTIEIRPPADPRPLEEAARSLSGYDWLIFTSANGVRSFAERRPDLAAFCGRVCAIGPATRQAAEQAGLTVALMPREYVAEGLVEAFAAEDLSGKRILLPRAAVARDVAPEELRRRGARVDVVEAYRTAVPEGARERAREIFGGARKPEWVTFTSSSTVTNFVAAAGPEALAGVRVASIGPVTSATARRAGIQVDAEAAEYTAAGLVAAILRA
jgi:uroporphyrinogen III methyltransferase/synthase